MFGLKEIGLALDSRDCIVLSPRRRGEIEEMHHPALAQVRDTEIRAVGQRAYRLVGKTRGVVTVFPGRVEDSEILGGYLRRVIPRDAFVRRRIWASVPTACGMQALSDLRHCFEGSLRPKETVLVPELLAAALGCGLPVLRSDEESHKARMVVHIGTHRISAGVFLDGGLAGLVVREGSWDQLIREVQENLAFRLGTALGFNTYFKVIRSLSRSFFDRNTARSGPSKPPAPPVPVKNDSELPALPEGPVSNEMTPELGTPLNLRGFSERGLIEYVAEEETVSRAIDVHLRNLLFGIEKIVFGCFSQLRNDGHGEIANDLLSDRVVICGDVFFDPAQLARHFARLSRFRFESTNGHAVARGLRRILASSAPHKAGYRELARAVHERGRLLTSSL